jgi:tetratricopeptide (TPR) repeat protein
LASGDYKLALRKYTEAIGFSQGQDHTLYSNRAFAFTKLGEFARALSDANEAIDRAPRWSKGYFRRAEAYRLAGLPVEALQAYRVASTLDPSDEHLVASCYSAATDVRMAQRQGYVWAAVGLVIGLALALVLCGSEAYTRGQAAGSLALGAMSLCTLGALGGAGSHELMRYQVASRVAPPLMANDVFVRYQFDDMPARKLSKKQAAAEGAAAAADETAAEGERNRRARSTNKSFRNRAGGGPGPRPKGLTPG